jgi:hypothetical protein
MLSRATGVYSTAIGGARRQAFIERRRDCKREPEHRTWRPELCERDWEATAVGLDAEASGLVSTTIGNSSTASGASSVGIG